MALSVPPTRQLSASGARVIALKVPEVTVYFWIVKLLTTAMGEATTDYFVFQIDPNVAVRVGFAGLAITLVLQVLTRRYVPWIYWLTVVMVAVFGTMAADVLHVVLGVPYIVSTVGFASALMLVFAAWYTLVEHAFAITHPGLPEYLALLAGDVGEAGRRTWRTWRAHVLLEPLLEVTR